MSAMELADMGDARHRSAVKRRPRPCSASYIAVRDALYQLTRLNDFRAEKIGGGFYADVFKVTHKTTGEVMVLKMNKNSKFSRQMLTEIQLMNRLSHPNILRFKGSCVHEGQLHALTEYINGGSLEDLLHNRSISLSWSVRVKIALDIAKGMAYLHSRGVFHRDLSSRNCLIQIQSDGSMKCVVADFGLAAKIKESRRRTHTEVVGSPYWMAPECLNGKEYCEQADVFSYGIVLAETATRLPADPDFMPRTRVYGMDFQALHKMCLDCPQDMWDLMVRCCQIDPDERPEFEEAVRILEQTVVVPEEGAESREGGDEDLRACFSEPLLRLQDSDDNTSLTSEQSSTHLLPPINSSESLESYSANSLTSSCLGRHHLEQDHRAAALIEETDGLRDDDVFEDTSSSSSSTATKLQKSLTLPARSARFEEGRTSCGQLESDDEGPNKGDSGIDPGEMFVAPVISPGDVGQHQTILSLCGDPEKAVREEQIDRDGKRVERSSLTDGDVSTPCQSPTHTQCTTSSGTPRSEARSEAHTELLDSSSASAAPPMYHSPSNELVRATTPCDHRSCSPSSASDVSLFLPNPSTPWAPPPSPLRSNSYRLSSSLPSSPTSQKKRLFRFSMEVQEALFPPFDPSLFSSPSSFGVSSVTLRSTPKSTGGGQQTSKSKRQSLRHSCGHSTPLPTFPEDLESKDDCLHDSFLWRDGVNTDLDRERFSGTASLPRFMRRTRSASNPTPQPQPTQPAHYTLNLARYSPCSGSHAHKTVGSSSVALYKYYTIRPCLNCRLSSSEPNLLTLSSNKRLI